MAVKKKRSAPAAKAVKAAKGSALSPELESVRAFSDFMKENGISELEFKTGDRHIRLRRGSDGAPAASASLPTYVNGAAPAASKVDALPEPRKNLHVVTSPFVGTFYKAAGPNQDPFVQTGQMVSTGDALCIVEAMKLMNEIESDCKGRIVGCLVENGTPVEFGEPLFEIEKA